VRIQPRQHLLDIWQATVRASWRDREWIWGGRDGSNSISDAEQLLCLLLPATQIPIFALDQPDITGRRIANALKPLGDEHAIPIVLVRVLTDYFQRYTDSAGRPLFAGGSYFNSAGKGGEPTKEQRALDIVDSFAVSVTLSLATIGFSRVYKETPRQAVELTTEIEALEAMANTRLTGAMVGLLRSFSVQTFTVDSAEGADLVRTVNQDKKDPRDVAQQLREALAETTASLGEVLIGSGQTTALRDRPNDLYECGWSWGIVADAPVIELEEAVSQQVGLQPQGVAQNAPYLYFTVLALDAIEDLFSERTRVLNLLDEEQQRLTRALQLRWELTRRYWAAVATFGDGRRWPLEDIPWRTTDHDETDYYTLLVTSVAVKGMAQRRGSDSQLSRIGAVLSELANRARVTRRPVAGDPNVVLHSPGVELTLIGSDTNGGKPLRWTVSEFASLLMQRSLVIATLLRDVEQRDRLLGLADQVWDHLAQRRLTGARTDQLWDQPANIFNGATTYEEPSWYFTERVVQGLVTAAKLLTEEPLVNERLGGFANDLLAEAEHLYDMELMNGSTPGVSELGRSLTRIRVNLERGRALVSTRPGTAVALVSEALRLLDEMAAARQVTS